MTNLVSRRRHLASAAFFLILIFIFAQARAQKKDSAGSVLQPDKGKFSVVLEGKTIGHEEFEIAPTGAGWLARGTTTLKSDKGTDTKVTGNLTLQPDGSPVAYDWSAQTDKTNGAHILFANQYAVLARLYDWSKRGSQQLPVLIPQELTPGMISLESTGSASSGGKSYEGLRVTTTDLEIDLLLDTNHKLMRLEVPSAKVAVVRD